MTRKEYRAQLEALRQDVAAMGDLTADRLETALDALDRRDGALGREVITGDAEINERYLAVEADCLDLFALQQPVASDLRLVAASFKIVTDLERVADLATNLGRYAGDAERTIAPDVDVGRIGSAATVMLRDALAAYEREEPDACRAVAAADDELDALCGAAIDAIVAELVERDGTPDGVTTEVPRLLLTVRDLERVGDHAVNVAGRTLYMIEGDDELLY